MSVYLMQCFYKFETTCVSYCQVIFWMIKLHMSNLKVLNLLGIKNPIMRLSIETLLIATCVDGMSNMFWKPYF